MDIFCLCTDIMLLTDPCTVNQANKRQSVIPGGVSVSVPWCPRSCLAAGAVEQEQEEEAGGAAVLLPAGRPGTAAERSGAPRPAPPAAPRRGPGSWRTTPPC